MDSILSWLWRGVGVLSVLVIACFCWLYFFVPSPQTVATTYINSLSALDKEDTPLEDATFVMDIQLLKNKDNSGQELFEMGFTTYQGTNTSKKYTKGVQVVGDFNALPYASYKTPHWEGWFNLKDFYLWYDHEIKNSYYYDIDYTVEDGVAFASTTALNNDSVFMVSVGSGDNFRLAELRLKNEVIDKDYYRCEWWGSYDGWLTNWYEYNLVSLNYMIASVHNSVQSLDAGTYFITFDLSEFFNVYIQDDSGKFNILTQDTQFCYVTARVNVEDNGISTRAQSMFGMVAENDGSISFEIDENEKKFWRAYENVTIGNECLVVRDSSYYSGSLVSIDNATISKLNNYEDLRIHLVIDLSQFENVIGVDAFGLVGLNYYDITILGNPQTFYFMSNSLQNVEVKSINYSHGIDLVIFDNVDIDKKVVA